MILLRFYLGCFTPSLSFQKEEFVNSVPAIQSFLDWFVETAMFRSFIQDRLQNDIEGKSAFLHP